MGQAPPVPWEVFEWRIFASGCRDAPRSASGERSTRSSAQLGLVPLTQCSPGLGTTRGKSVEAGSGQQRRDGVDRVACHPQPDHVLDEPLPEATTRWPEVGHKHPAARAQYTGHLGSGSLSLGLVDVVQREARRHDVERTIHQRQRLGEADEVARASSDAWATMASDGSTPTASPFGPAASASSASVAVAVVRLSVTVSMYLAHLRGMPLGSVADAKADGPPAQATSEASMGRVVGEVELAGAPFGQAGSLT